MLTVEKSLKSEGGYPNMWLSIIALVGREPKDKKIWPIEMGNIPLFTLVKTICKIGFAIKKNA